jgi:hypothetical protein
MLTQTANYQYRRLLCRIRKTRCFRHGYFRIQKRVKECQERNGEELETAKGRDRRKARKAVLIVPGVNPCPQGGIFRRRERAGGEEGGARIGVMGPLEKAGGPCEAGRGEGLVC